MIKILVLCDQGNNRSVTLAHQLKYMGYDVLTAGLDNNSHPTLEMLCLWADKIILTNTDQSISYCPEKQTTWKLGLDYYPRPFNEALLKKVKRVIAERRHELDEVEV